MLSLQLHGEEVVVPVLVCLGCSKVRAMSVTPLCARLARDVSSKRVILLIISAWLSSSV